MKKLKFDIFSDTLTVGVRKGSRGLYSKVCKIAGGEEIVIAKLLMDGIKSRDAVTVRSIADEIYWKVTGSNIIFPESEKLFNALRNSKIELKGNAEDVLEFPYKAFVLATPKGSGMRSRLVTIAPLREKSDCINKYLGDKLPEPMEFTTENGGGMNVEVCVCDQISTEHATAHSSYLLSELADIANSKDVDEYMEKMSAKAVMGRMTMSQYDIEEMFHFLKLVVAYGVYYKAMGTIREGLPRGYAPREHAGKGYTFRTLNNELGDHLTGATYVNPFFRNLVADRYYKGEHEDKPIGSRWVLVKPHLRGTKGKPSTLS